MVSAAGINDEEELHDARDRPAIPTQRVSQKI